MKKLLLSVAILLGATAVNAQTPVGTVVSNFTLTDINGTTHSLFDYLDAGKMVVIDVSATWCGPCWNYHNTGALDDFYLAHGPSGDNTAMAFFIEGDVSTNSADLHGTGSNTQGDWVTGENLPIIDLTTSASFTSSGLVIPYYPVMYVICPNRVVLASGVAGAIGTLSNLNGMIGDCPAPASQPADAAALSFDSPVVVCGGGSYTPVVTIQNNGTTAMTSATITISSGGTTVSTGTFSGNLATYGTSQITCSAIPSYNGGTLNVVVTTSGDANAANGMINPVVDNAIQANGITGTVAIVTDAYGSETTWKIKNSGGTVIASGGPYNDLTAAGTTVQTVANVNFSPNTCYTFTIYDAYGDGINSGYGAGSYTVKDATGATLATGGDFMDEESKAFKSGVAGIEEMSIEGFNVYPNPATSVLNIAFEATNADYTVSLVDLQGRVISSNVYYNLADSQSIELSVDGIASGNYLVKVVSNGAMSVENVVIR
jgi:hypothetical protein